MRPTELLTLVADKLGELRNRLVFVGGATSELLITDLATPPVSATKDVDAIVSVTATEYLSEIADTLRACGFAPDTSEDAPICRYRLGEMKLDVMPVDGAVLGFSNRWFQRAYDSATPRMLPNGQSINLVSAPCFLATKLDAFHDRGAGDYMGHKDIEDVLAVLGGRSEVAEEISTAPEDVRQYLIEQAASLLATPDFVASITGHLPGEDPQVVLSRLGVIAAL